MCDALTRLNEFDSLDSLVSNANVNWSSQPQSTLLQTTVTFLTVTETLGTQLFLFFFYFATLGPDTWSAVLPNDARNEDNLFFFVVLL